jgi:hypothetical protein
MMELKRMVTQKIVLVQNQSRMKKEGWKEEVVVVVVVVEEEEEEEEEEEDYRKLRGGIATTSCLLT